MKKNNVINRSFNGIFAAVATTIVLLMAGSVNASAQGGVVALVSFLQQNLKYPEEAKEKEIQGRVIVQFTIETDGSVSDVSVLQSVHPLVDAQVVNAISSMTGWKPGMHEGKPVH